MDRARSATKGASPVRRTRPSVGRTRPDTDHLPDRLWIAALVVLGLGVVFQGLRAWTGGWIASGDDGFWSIMARSVLSADPPLLGSSSSGGVVSGDGFHHPGPLGFYLLAPFVAVLGGVGLAVGTALLNAASAVVAAVAVRCSIGRRAGWLVVCAGALLAWTMGSELLVDPWNPHLATLPLWCGLACAWAALCGGRWWAAPSLFALSLSAQTHLSFAPLAAAVGVAVIVATVWWCRLHAREQGLRAWRPLAVALAALLVANLVTLVEQFAASGEGNLTRLLRGAGDGSPLGVVTGARAVGQAFVPTNWLPGSWRPQVIEIADLPSAWCVVLVLAGVVALFVASVRRRDLLGAIATGFAAVALIVAVAVASRTAQRLFGVPLALVRYAWPLSLLVGAVSADTAWRLFAPSTLEVRRLARPVAAAGLSVVVVLTAWNLVPRDEGSGASADYRAPIREVLDAGTAAVAARGTPLVEFSWHKLAAEATVALLDRLDEDGVGFSVDDPVVLRQSGPRHAPDGSEGSVVRMAGGAAVLEPPPEGFERVARTVPLDDAEVAWFLERRAELQPALDDLIARTESDPSLRRGVVAHDRVELTGELLGWNQLLCGHFRLLDVDAVEIEQIVDADDRERLCELQERLDTGALALDLGPPPR